MGSSGSKKCRGSFTVAAGEADAAAASSGERRRRSRSHWSLPASCLSSTSASHDSDHDEQHIQHKSHGRTKALEDNPDCYKESEKKNVEDEKSCMSSDELELDEFDQANVPMTNGNSRSASSSRSLTIPGRIFSHFRFITSKISSRLGRASSSRSLNAYPVSSSHQTTSNDLEGVTSLSESSRTNDMQLASHFNRACLQGFEASTGTSPSNCSTYQHEHRVPMVENVIRDFGAVRAEEDANMRLPRGASEMDHNYAGFLDRRPVVQEPSERNVRFSRTLSVGRLRNRVLRRPSLSDFTFHPLEHQSEYSDIPSLGGELASGSQATASAAEGNPVTSASIPDRSSSSVHRSVISIQDHEMQAPRAREGRYQDLLEHRSNFFERRRRIRSQVRALQRLGNRFENDSGHDRSCALAGQNQTGHCTCRAGNHGDETNARASISRIVMLAEALFEVLDEIHQQSVVLSSQPSVSSIGSVPAPNDVVDMLPLKIYTNSNKERNDEALQCYICLLDYEEGDSIRTLPCHHEFHRTCVDKWLKDVHRVCPLCRGDICKVEIHQS